MAGLDAGVGAVGSTSSATTRAVALCASAGHGVVTRQMRKRLPR